MNTTIGRFFLEYRGDNFDSGDGGVLIYVLCRAVAISLGVLGWRWSAAR